MPFIPNTDQARKEMLNAIGVKSFEDLIANIPTELRFKGNMNLPEALSELEISNHIHNLARQNKSCEGYISFLGGGGYDHFIPAAIDQISSRPEFYTAYTPYQPEVSQGTLQVIYEYQSMIAELTAMDVSNASMYDGSSALAEAALMAISETRRKKIIISQTISPFYRQVIATYLSGQDIQIVIAPMGDNGITHLEKLASLIDENTAAVLIQHPNFLGYLEEVDQLEQMIHAKDALFITSNDPISLAILEAPGNYGADIATGEGQCLGNALNFGGPYLGILATREQYKRLMPGRIAGMTTDINGKDGFVLTFQTREQHIRREKATSNICTNQALNALIATVYLSLLGKQGLIDVATLCLQKSHYLAEQIQSLDHYHLKFESPFFKEFVVSTPSNPENSIKHALKKGILPGINLNKFDFGLDNCLLIAVTEKRTEQEIDKLLDIFKLYY